MRESNLIKTIDNRIYFKIFVALLWSKGILLEYARGVLLNLPILSSVADYVIPCLMGLMFLLSFKPIAERLRGADFMFVMACIVVYIFEFWLYKRNRDFFRMEFLDFLLGCLPFYFVGVALREDDGTIIRILYRISGISILAFAFYMTFINQMDSTIVSKGDMASAYNLLPHGCLVFYYLMKEFRWGRLLLFLVSAISILMMGTRGAVLCLLIFVVIVTALTIRFQKPFVLFGLVLICLLFIIFPQITDGLIDVAYFVAGKFGFSTRFFDKLLSGTLTVSSGRVAIRQRVWHYLGAYPIVGLGVYGDRFVALGQYAHNFFVEIYANFGYLFGTILLVAFAVLVYRGLAYVFRKKDENGQMITLLLLCCCFKLMISSSYLREPFFWILLGYLASLIREYRAAEQSSENPKKEGKKESKFIR